MASAKPGTGGRRISPKNGSAPPPDADGARLAVSDGYGAHPAVQERGIAEAEHKPEGMLSKTFGLLKGVLKKDGQPQQQQTQQKKLQRQMAKKWQSSEVAAELNSADGSSQGGKSPTSKSPTSRYTGQQGNGGGLDVNQPATPERPPTVALSGMSLSGKATKGGKARGTKRGAQDTGAAVATRDGAGAEGRMTRSKSRRLAVV